MVNICALIQEKLYYFLHTLYIYHVAKSYSYMKIEIDF
jgi:hypothetical protein